MIYLLKLPAFTISIAVILLTALLLFISCKKELSCENCRDGNKPPIANAGADQTITLPKDSVVLDGSLSTDADGKIIAFKWVKIAGPALSNIVKADSSKTVVRTLVAGVYQFELTVTDNGGLFSRDTLHLLVDAPGNQPPVACAGGDQTITLPANTISLDGSCSVDPDNNINSYLWTKIAGPIANITSANTIQTQVTNLTEGVYQFELKVMDAGNLFSRDTVQVTVESSVVSTVCNNSSRQRINLQLIQISTLPQKLDIMAVASAGNKIVFAGALQSVANGTPDAAIVNIYDIVTQTWSTARLSDSRTGVAAVAAGNKIFFAGGKLGDGAPDQIFSTVDIYDAIANTWSKASLSEPRSYVAAATVGNKVYFAGGNLDMWYTKSSDIVDVYDLSSNSWSTMQLSQPRQSITTVTANNKIYFGGGYSRMGTDQGFLSDRIDVYNNATNSWSTTSLKESKSSIAGIAVNNKIYWAGGFRGRDYPSCLVEINDVKTGNNSVDYLSGPEQFYINGGENAVSRDNKIIFYRSSDSKLDIFDISTNNWSIGVLPINLTGAAIISVNNTIYLAGGSSDKLWKLQF